MRYTEGAPNKLYVVVDPDGDVVVSRTNLNLARAETYHEDTLAVYRLDRIARKPKVVRN